VIFSFHFNYLLFVAISKNVKTQNKRYYYSNR